MLCNKRTSKRAASKRRSQKNQKGMLPLAGTVLAGLLLVVICCTAFVQPASAASSPYVSTETGYQAVIEDGANLLSDSEEERLMERMKQILPYGNVAFVTSDAPNSDAARYARDWFLNYFGKVSGTVLLIDMYNRRIEIFSGEAVYRQINTTRANEITDNSYEYASRGDYFGCADKTFEQMVTVLEGGSIVTPMRFATNAAFAIGIVFLVNFVIVYMQRRKARDVMALRTANDRKGADNLGAVKSVRKVMTSQTKRKHVEASSGGGGGFSGGGGGFSGGGGGGGFSGGGGGHSF